MCQTEQLDRRSLRNSGDSALAVYGTLSVTFRLARLLLALILIFALGRGERTF